MIIEYRGVECLCGREFVCESNSPEYVMYQALLAGWGIDHCEMICPGCVEGAREIQDRILIGITPENKAELSAWIYEVPE